MRIKNAGWADPGLILDFSLGTYKMAVAIILLVAMNGGEVSCVKEPFDLEFGLKAGDNFTAKGDSPTSSRQFLNGSFLWGNKTVDYIQTNSNLEVYLMNAAGVKVGTIDVADFDGDSQDYLYDAMCLQYSASFTGIEDICDYVLYGDSDYVDGDMDYHDYVIGTHYFYTQVMVKEWDTMKFPMSLVDIYWDDLITEVVMGPDTKYPNLANNIFVRTTLSQRDKEVLSARIGGDFSVDSGFVVTIYKVADYEIFNTFHSNIQFAVACDEKNTTDFRDNECYTMTQYAVLQTFETDFELSFSFSSNSYDTSMPFDDYEEAVMVEVKSNVGVDGLWIYEINQGTEGPFVRLPYKVVKLCGGAYAKPSFAPMDKYDKFSFKFQFFHLECTGILDYSSSFASELVVKLIGSSFNKTIPDSDIDYQRGDARLEVELPDFWGAEEVVGMVLSVDGWEQKIDATLSFTPVDIDGQLNITPTASDSVQVSWPLATINETTPILITEYTYNGTGQGYEEVFEEEIDLESGNITIHYTFGSNHLVRFQLKSYQGTFVSILAKKGTTDCVDWLHDQLDKDLSECSAELEENFACPANSGSPYPIRNDAFWAHEEVARGPHGWYYDPCCNKENTSVSQSSHVLSMCDEKACDYNPAALFCIRSPAVECYDSRTRNTLHVSNQCCYDPDGTLMTDPHQGAGRMSLNEATAANMHHFYRNELEPYEVCCADTMRCPLFHSNRPTTIGDYSGSLTVPIKFGGHFTTAEGLEFKLLGLGVFTLLETPDMEQPTMIQLSTRAIGHLTVVSGLAIQYANHKIEIMRPSLVPEGKGNRIRNFIYINDDYYMLLTDLMSMGPDDPFDLYFSGMTIKQREGGCHVQIVIPGINLIVNLQVIHNYFNVFLTLPDSFRGHTRGLVGTWDGIASNDFLPKSPRMSEAPISSLSDPEYIYDFFAESWRVIEQDDWLFGTFLSGMVKADMTDAPIQFNYTESQQVYDMYSQTCAEDWQCTMDVHRSGREQFASDYQSLRDKEIPGSQTGLLNEFKKEKFSASPRIWIPFVPILTALVAAQMGKLFLFN